MSLLRFGALSNCCGDCETGSGICCFKEQTILTYPIVQVITLVEKYGPFTIDYDTDTSVKRIKTLRNNMVSYTAVLIISYGGVTIQ
jgi:hypothetical protein